MSPLVPLKCDFSNSSSEVRECSKLAIFGSTGSVGVTCLEVLKKIPSLELSALFAHRSVEKFVLQVKEYQPKVAGLVDEDANEKARTALQGEYQGEWLGSRDEILSYAVSGEYDLQLSAVVGIEGIETSLPAFAAGKRIALANKESLVVGGRLFHRYMEDGSEGAVGEIIPVDSEHSSLFRLLRSFSDFRSKVNRIGLTASGGPFRTYSSEQLSKVTVDDALNHPTWSMGPRITLDSATLMNKAFEFIEATVLFDVPPEMIEVKIHPQSVIHGFIELNDGSHLMHASPPTMSFPVAYAIGYPHIPNEVSAPFQNGTLEVFECDEDRFRAIPLARAALGAGEGALLRFYAANEVAAQAFLERKVPFNKIMEFVDISLEKGDFHSFSSSAELQECLTSERKMLSEMLFAQS